MASPLVSDLATLVAFPSVSDRPLGDLVAYLAERFERLGFRVEHHEDPAQHGKASLVATAGPARGDRSGLVLSGHMDVVPTEGQPWSSDPFVLTERNGKLYGRGSADMKGFFACTLQALECVRVADLQRELVLVWTHDEEVGCLGSAQLAQKLVGRPLPRACLIGEPTDFQILRMHPGHVGASIVITGKAAHSSRPHLGVNAIEAAADVIGVVREIARELGPDVPVNVGRIEGGGAINIVPDRCVIHLGYRPPPGMAADEVYRRIQARLAEFSSNARVEAKLLRVTPSLLTREGTPLERILAPMADVPGTGMATFATDGGNLEKLGLEPLVFGPGSIEVAHKADEHVSIEALERGATMVERVIRACCL